MFASSFKFNPLCLKSIFLVPYVCIKFQFSHLCLESTLTVLFVNTVSFHLTENVSLTILNGYYILKKMLRLNYFSVIIHLVS